MPLDKATLITDLLEIFTYESVQETDPVSSRTRIANKFATAIEKFVKSGDGKYQAATLQAGATPVTGTGSGIIVKIE